MIQRDQIVGTDANRWLNIDELLRSYNRNLADLETIAVSEPNPVRGIQNRCSGEGVFSIVARRRNGGYPQRQSCRTVSRLLQSNTPLSADNFKHLGEFTWVGNKR